MAGRLLMYLNNDTHITADAALWQFHSTCSLEISTGLQTKLSTKLKHTVTLWLVITSMAMTHVTHTWQSHDTHMHSQCSYELHHPVKEQLRQECLWPCQQRSLYSPAPPQWIETQPSAPNQRACPCPGNWSWKTWLAVQPAFKCTVVMVWCMAVVMLSISCSTVDCCFTVQRFDCEGLCQVLNCLVPDKDLCGRSVVLLQSTVRCEMLNVLTDCYINP